VLHPERSRPFRWVQKVVPTTPEPDGQSLFVRRNGKILATPFFLVLVLIELTDVVFAVDSILAIFAITEDPFIVFTSNVFAVLGLRSLYFVLSSLATRFDYLQPGLAIILIFVGLKMAISDIYKLPVLVSLAVVFTLLAGSIIASVIKTKREQRRAA
jgi:tellurite resistance protein TerC